MAAPQAYKRPALHGAAQLDYAHDHLPVQLAAVVAEYCVERLQISALGEVRHHRASPRRDLQEAHACQILQADVHYRLAYLHLLRQVALAGQALSRLELTREYHALDALYEQLLYSRRHNLAKFHSIISNHR